MFHFSDYISVWIVCIFLIAIVVFGALMNMRFYLLVATVLLIVALLWSVCKPNSECFVISSDKVTIINGKKQRSVCIPYNPIIVISYADVCSPFQKHICSGNQSYMLRGRYAITILNDIPLNSLLDLMHQSYVRKYTNSLLQSRLDEHIYIYSFVGNQELLDVFLAKEGARIIIPETLLNQISTGSKKTNVIVDVGY